MKIERDDKPFVPVVITLETEKELEGLFHVLNCGPEYSLNHYMSNGVQARADNMLSVKMQLWTTLRNFVNKDQEKRIQERRPWDV
uniref:Uncharacterized protein n=1 Tax=viral metagenome TaxID=1070528 RepID=A0A6M3L0G2_9ZZZZ